MECLIELTKTNDIYVCTKAFYIDWEVCYEETNYYTVITEPNSNYALVTAYKKSGGTVDNSGKIADTKKDIKDAIKDMEDALDACIDFIIRKIRKNKTKVSKKLRDDVELTWEDEDEDVAEDEFDIIRSKTVFLKPEMPEEAILQMEMLGHQFYIFFNGESEKVCVVYKRKDGGYGLIEPEVE